MEKSCPNYDIADIINSKKLKNNKQILKEIKKINELDTKKINKVSFAGNNIVYHYFFEELLKTKRDNKNCFLDVWNDEDERQLLINQAIKRDRRKKENIIHPEDLYECWRINGGSITFFKPSIMKTLVSDLIMDKDDDTFKVLDLTMGWGGRMIGAISSIHNLQKNIKYVGFDTNTELIKPYNDLILDCFKPKGYTQENEFHHKYYFEEDVWGNWEVDLHYEDFINVHNYYEGGEFNCMISSPPYFNMEVYPHMTPFNSKNEYYEWLVTYITTSCIMVKKGGYVMVSLSKKIYDELIKRRPDMECDYIELMGQQMGKSNKKDYIYVWII